MLKKGKSHSVKKHASLLVLLIGLAVKMNFMGNTGIKVSEICFGTMTFGGKGIWSNVGAVDQTDATSLVHQAMDAGVNFFDTADVYSEGLAEEMLGKAIGTNRRDVVLATKVRGKMGKGCNDVGLSRLHIMEGCNASLKRLGTDCIDLYQVHSFDPKTPLEETLRALDDLVRAGKVRYIGASNFASWQLMKALAISERCNLEKFVTLQMLYSLVARDLENDLIPLCLDQHLGLLTWSPLGGGFLTGKYRKNGQRPMGRRANAHELALQFDEEKAYDVVGALTEIAQTHHTTIPQSALNYLLRKPGVTSVIIGARNELQLADNLRTVNWELAPEEMQRLDELSKPPSGYPYWTHDRNKLDR